MKNNYVFLLGGKDLEMVEIEKILKKSDCKYIDNDLSWGAKLSDYLIQLKGLKKDDIVVGIELYKDINIANKYIDIEHHNKNINKLSAIEQVAQMLNIELNRYQNLVAENDKGYIQALKDFGATDKEINDIRTRDRKCQGVTEEDERLAQRSIKENKRTENEVVIIKSLTDKFSPICDRLHTTRKLIIYTNNELNYYGRGARKLGTKYQELYDDKKVYFGGGENGFFGFAKGVLNQNEIERIIEEIISIKSYHIFMFPFKWEYKANKNSLEELSFEERTDVSKVSNILKQGNWVEDSLKDKIGENHRIYNELIFFYEHVQDAIYSKGDYANDLVCQFKYTKSGRYIIEIDTKKEDEEVIKRYELKIDDIILKLYKTGIGILSFHLANYYETDSDDILKINDYGRRVYPQFLGKSDKYPTYLSAPQKQFLANKLILELDQPSKKIEEDFTHFNSLYKVNDSPNKIAKIINELLGNKFKDGKKSEVKKGEVYIKPIIDDRMFVISWFGDNSKIIYLNNSVTNKKYKNYLNYFNPYTKEYSYLNKNTEIRKKTKDNVEFWYKYIFIDTKEPTCQSNIMFKKLLEEHTYDRWINYGTLYGISRYSFVVLTSDLPTLKDDDSDYIFYNTITIYYQMITLALAQRAAIIRFSEEISYISKLDDKNLVDRVRELHKKYIHFINRMYFNEITAQEQGIDLYDIIQRKIGIEKDAKRLETEIAELHQYATLIEEKKSSELLNLITIIGSLFIIPSLATGFFGMDIESFTGTEGIFKDNILEFLKNTILLEKKSQEVWYWLGIYFSLPACILYIILYLLRNSKAKKKIGTIIILLLIILPILFSIYLSF